MRYFQRAHATVCRAPLERSAAWKGADLARRSDVVGAPRSASRFAELERAAGAVERRKLDLSESARTFPLPSLAPRIARWATELMRGAAAFCCCAAFPVERWGEDVRRSSIGASGPASRRARRQNHAGDLLGHVIDRARTRTIRSSPLPTRGDIAYNCDLADDVGLLWSALLSAAAAQAA